MPGSPPAADLRFAFSDTNPGLLQGLARSLAGAMPGRRVLAFRLRADGSLGDMAAAHDALVTSDWRAIRGSQSIARYSTWTPLEPAWWWNRGTRLREVFPDRRDLEFAQRTLLLPNGVRDLVRCVLAPAEPRISPVHLGIYYEDEDHPQSHHDQDALNMQIPTILQAMRDCQLVEADRAAPQSWLQVLDLFDQPAWLFNAAGCLMTCNLAARESEIDVVDVVQDVRQTRFSWRPVQLAGQMFFLASTTTARTPASQQVLQRQPLAPALVPVAMLLTTGARDRQIAEQLERPISTIRTYVTRILRHYGVHSRSQLVALLSSQPLRRHVASTLQTGATTTVQAEYQANPGKKPRSR